MRWGTATPGDRKLLQGTVDERRLVNSPCGDIQVGKLFTNLLVGVCVLFTSTRHCSAPAVCVFVISLSYFSSSVCWLLGPSAHILVKRP